MNLGVLFDFGDLTAGTIAIQITVLQGLDEGEPRPLSSREFCVLKVTDFTLCRLALVNQKCHSCFENCVAIKA